MIAGAILTWGLWYRDFTMIGVGIAGLVIGMITFREPKRFTSFGARAIAWEALALRSKRHVFLYIVAIVPITSGLWQNNTAWISLGLLGILIIIWHFSITRFMPRDAGRVILVDEEIVPRHVLEVDIVETYGQEVAAPTPVVDDRAGAERELDPIPEGGTALVQEPAAVGGDEVLGDEAEGEGPVAIGEEGKLDQERTVRRKVRKRRKRKRAK